MKISKPQARLHLQAEELLKKDKLTFDDKVFVLENWREDYSHNTGWSGAFFTPYALAREFNIEVTSGASKVIDLCAGIGSLAFQVTETNRYEGRNAELVCVEVNPEYVRVGQKVVPEATWIQGSVLGKELIKSLGKFNHAISNPPYGRIPKGTQKGWLNYTGSEFEYKVIEIASLIADHGTFLIPQESCGFKYSHSKNDTSVHGYKCNESEKYKKFKKQTGIEFEMNCGIDTGPYENQWNGVSVMPEITLCSFDMALAKSMEEIDEIVKDRQISLFEEFETEEDELSYSPGI